MVTSQSVYGYILARLSPISESLMCSDNRWFRLCGLSNLKLDTRYKFRYNYVQYFGCGFLFQIVSHLALFLALLQAQPHMLTWWKGFWSVALRNMHTAQPSSVRAHPYRLFCILIVFCNTYIYIYTYTTSTLTVCHTCIFLPALCIFTGEAYHIEAKTSAFK